MEARSQESAGGEPAEDTQLVFHLALTPAQMKVTHTALVLLRDDLGHEELDFRRVVQQVLDKLPGEHDMRAIDLGREVRRRSAPEVSAD